MRDSSLILDVPIIDITTYLVESNKRIEDLKCQWFLDNNHDHVVATVGLFNGQIIMPICDRHLIWHRCILALHSVGLDVMQVLTWSRDVAIKETISRGLMPIKD